MEPSGFPTLAPDRLLVTGVDTVVGANIALALSDRFDVCGLFEKTPVALNACVTAAWRPDDAEAVRRAVRAQSPRWIIHCGPLARSSWGNFEGAAGLDREPRLCAWLAKVAAKLSARLTVISTDAVFTGPWLFHEEMGAGRSSLHTANVARRAERSLAGTGALVIRTNAYGWGIPHGETGIAESIWQSLREGRDCRLDCNRSATPILAADLAELLAAAHGRGLEGVYHMAGAERTSLFRFGHELAAVFGLANGPTPAATNPRLARAVGSAQGRATRTLSPPWDSAETSLCTGRARRDLERPMPLLREGLNRFAAQAGSGYRQRIACRGLAPVARDAA